MFGPLALPLVDTARQRTDHPFIAAHAPDAVGAGVFLLFAGLFVCHVTLQNKRGQPVGCPLNIL
nr:MAG TPA: hypothetical protein [Caudoviricetes sp.]